MDNKPVTTYCEMQIGKTIYQATSTYKGEICLAKVMEESIADKIVKTIKSQATGSTLEMKP